MFRNRNSQKPTDQLIADFQAAFPSLSSSGRSANLTTADTQPGGIPTTTSLTDALDFAMPSRHHEEDQDIKDLDPTPRADVDHLRFTPSMLDPNCFAFSNFANQPPGYYTPTPGGTNTIYYPQAGDLHTPGFTMGLGTPLSMPKSEPDEPAGQTSRASAAGFQAQIIAPNMLQNHQPFDYQGVQQTQHSQHSQQSCAAHQFSQKQTIFERFYDQRSINAKMSDHSVDVEMQEQQALEPFDQSPIDLPIGKRPPRPENFRYHVTLNAPTAMIRHSDEIPVTYLNKGQAYSIAIKDTIGANPGGAIPTYRTYIRISFKDDQQRQRPAQCWQLWKEGRGTSEAHHRGGRLQAVEFVGPHQQMGDMDQSSRPVIELESASFDGFSVKWSPPPNAPAECSISVRFNFLSTDFSHTKGVKGITVGLCAKTQISPGDMQTPPTAAKFEICYCKVKLFRDHGAERKLANDITHEKKSIEKLKAQVSQLESGTKNTSKKRRIESGMKSSTSKPGKTQRHKRTWSVSSASDAAGKQALPEENLQVKLMALEDMFTSTRPVSMLFLRGEEADDPDLHPVHLSGCKHPLQKTGTGKSFRWDLQSTQTSSIVSPTPSIHSRQSLERTDSASLRRQTSFQQSMMGSDEWSAAGSATQFGPSEAPSRVQRMGHECMLPEWIEAMGVDSNYRPPPGPVIKPVACFYVKPRILGVRPMDNYHRAVYVMQCTLADLVNGIATKIGVDPSKVLRTVRINKQGLSSLMGDQTVIELPEGQDMVAEILSVPLASPMKREWGSSGSAEVGVDGCGLDAMQSEGYEMRLLF